MRKSSGGESPARYTHGWRLSYDPSECSELMVDSGAEGDGDDRKLETIYSRDDIKGGVYMKADRSERYNAGVRVSNIVERTEGTVPGKSKAKGTPACTNTELKRNDRDSRKF